MGVVVRLQPAGRAEALEALATAEAAPKRSTETAASALRWAEADGDVETMVIAARALGLAARAVEDFEQAGRHLDLAIELAEDHGLDLHAGQARMSLA
ncbi:MAG: hypothetical protein ACRDZW_00275, partial [Acidimicrobiales bacterium]